MGVVIHGPVDSTVMPNMQPMDVALLSVLSPSPEVGIDPAPRLPVVVSAIGRSWISNRE